MDALDFIFDNYEDFLNLSECFRAKDSEWIKLETQFCNSLTKEQKADFDSWNRARIKGFKNSQKETFKCGVRAGARLVFDLMDKDATNIENVKKKADNLYDFGIKKAVLTAFFNE